MRSNNKATFTNRFSLTLLFAAFAFGTAMAADDANIAAGRPLRFDDARTIPFGDRQVEFGGGITGIRNFTPIYTFGGQFKYGFAENQEIGVGVNHFISNGSDSGQFFIHYMREVPVNDSGDAFAIAINAGALYGVGSNDAEVGFRGIMTRRMGENDRLHLNADVSVGEHIPSLGLILGYSRPFNSDGDFRSTLVGEVGLNRVIDDEFTLTLGLGMRRQMANRAVLDFGVLLGGLNRDNNRSLTFNLGYTMSF
ncbi:MAG: hypothetical protein KF812_11100 [Fimbriimonadaceae bacterium]|nr:hypothetical protein [Fimbriimonadaceae bacterium]